MAMLAKSRTILCHCGFVSVMVGELGMWILPHIPYSKAPNRYTRAVNTKAGVTDLYFWNMLGKCFCSCCQG